MASWKNVKNVHTAVKPLKPRSKKGDKDEFSDYLRELKEEKEKVVEPSAEEKKEAFRNFLNETLKSVFDLIMVNDKINITIDNVFPLMKTLELDTKDEAILDMVRTSCIETFGDIDEAEFDTAVVDLRKRTVGEEFEEDMRSAFHIIDYDEDGFITTSDIYQLMMGLGEMLTDYELDDLLKAADKDRDGKISYKDFKLFLVGEWTVEDEIREKGAEIVEEEEEVVTEKALENETKVEEKTASEGDAVTTGNKEETEVEKQEVDDDVEGKNKETVEENEVNVVKPSPKPRNSLLWGYLSTAEEEKNDAIAQYVAELEAKDKQIESIHETNEETTTDESNKETNADKENESIQEVKETGETIKDESDKETNSAKEPESDGNIADGVENDDLQSPTGMEKNQAKFVVDNVDSKDKDDNASDGKLLEDACSADNTDSKSQQDENDSNDAMDDARSVISVTVKHLDSILEEGEDDQDHGHVPASRPQSIRKSQLIRQSSSASLRIRPSSGLTESSIDVFGDDSGIEFIDGDDIKNEKVFDNFDDEGVYSRESSAKDRVASGKRRECHSQNSSFFQSIEEAPKDGFWEEDIPNESQRSVSTQLNVYASDTVVKQMLKTKSHRLHLCTENDGTIGPYISKRESDTICDIESEDSITKPIDKDGMDRNAQDNSIKRLHVQNLVVDHLYCEAGVEEFDSDRMEMGSILDYCSSISSPRPASRLHAGRKPHPRPNSHSYRRLLRTTSADRFKTIKQLENRILRHQNTDPQLNKYSIMKANERLNGIGRPNPNGLKCSHIDLDLGLGEELDVGQNFRPYSPLRRPRTAVTFKEANRRSVSNSKHDEYSKYDSGIDSPDTDEEKNISIVDLSQKLNTQFGDLEAPNQSLQHHGYKSVWPLARVMTAYNNKYNDGKSMQLNSISRRLERCEIPECWSERESPDIKFRDRPQTAREPLNVRVNSRPQTARAKCSVGGGQRPATAGSNSRVRPQTARVSRPPAQPVMLDHNSVKQSNGGIITLTLPFQTDSKTRYKRTAHSSNNRSKRTLYY